MRTSQLKYSRRKTTIKGSLSPAFLNDISPILSYIAEIMYNAVFTVPSSIYQSGRSPFISPPCTPSHPFPGPNNIYVPYTSWWIILTQTTTLYSESYDRQTTTRRDGTRQACLTEIEREPPTQVNSILIKKLTPTLVGFFVGTDIFGYRNSIH